MSAPVEPPRDGPRGARRARAAGAGLLVVVGALTAIQVVWIARHLGELRPLSPGDPAPRIVLPRADGSGRGDLDALRGRVVLIDFWATWCEPCRQTMPAIERLRERHEAAGFEVFSVNVDRGEDPAGAARRFAAAQRPPLAFPIYVDDGRASAAYRADMIPHMVLVDRLGRVRRVHTGAFRVSRLERQLDREIQELLGER